MVATMITMATSSSALLGGTVRLAGLGKSTHAGVGSIVRLGAVRTARRGLVRNGLGNDLKDAKDTVDSVLKKTFSDLKDVNINSAVDSVSKKTITKDDILRNQSENESEKKSVFGSVPSSGSLYPRPELERRPETGSTNLGSIFAFDGAAPETINGRLAMLGLVWAFLAERISGLTVFEQLYTPAGGFGLTFYIALVQLITLASIVPFLNGESTDARKFGPFRAKAERWNGRLAMLGFLALVLTEQFTHTPVFASWF